MVAALLAQAADASGQTFVWTGTANNNWNNAGNWTPGSPNAGGADLIVDVSTLDLTAAKTINLNNGTTTADRTVGTIIFGDTNASNATTFNWTLGANGGAGSNPKLILAVTTGTGTIQVNNGTTTISTLVAGTQGFAKTGAGTLALTNAGNTVTGGIALNAGTLSFVDGALGANLITSSGAVGLTWNATLADISSQIQIGDGSTLTLNLSNTAGENTIFATALQTGPLGTGGLVKANASNLTITAANTYTGGTKINNGRLILIGGDDRLSAAGALTFGNTGNSGILQLGNAAGASNQTVTGLAITGTGTANAVVGGSATNSIFTVNTTTVSTFNGILGGAGTNENNLTLVKTGAGTLTLGGANTFTGSVTIAGGKLVITKSTALGDGSKTVDISAATNTPSLQLNGAAGALSLPATLSFLTSNDDAVSPAIVNTAGNNVIAGSISPTIGGAGAGNTRILVNGGTLGLTGAISPAIHSAGALSVILDGAANGIATGLISDNGARQLGVTKEGAGTWTLTAGNAYTGPTFISSGRLNLTTGQTGGGALTVADGATFGLTLAVAGQSLSTSSLSLGSTTGATVNLDLGASGNPAVAVISAGSFSTPTAGTSILQIAATGLSIGQFPLISYSGVIGGGGYAGLALGSLPARVSAGLLDDGAHGKVLLNVTAFDIPRWTGGVDGTWDLDPDGTGAAGTLNWQEVTSGAVTRYLQGTGGTDSVLFDDTAGVPTNVLLTTALTPATVTVNTSLNAFVFSGAGKLSGATSLVKQGTSTLTLLNTGGNDFTGTTTINGGTLQLGDGATAGAGQLGSGLVVNNAALIFNRPDALTVANAISGSGTITKQGNGVLTLAGNNASYDGGITVSGGTLKLASMSALGSTAGGTVVSAGAALDITGFAVGEAVQLNGGTLKSLSGTTSTVNGLLTLNGGGVLDVLAGTLAVTTAISGAGGLAKSSAGTASLAGANSFSGGLTVNGGTLILTGANAYTGGTTITAGTLQIGITAGGSTTAAPGAGDIALNPATGSATLTILRGDNGFDLTNNITSAGAGVNTVTIGVTGATSPSGIVTLSGANTFTGNITINGGALRITKAAALGVGPKTVNIGSNAGPSLRLDGAAADITLPAGINFTASSDGTIANAAANPGAIVNVAGNNTIHGNIALTNGGGGNGRVSVLAGTLTLAGNIDSTGATGTRTLQLGGVANGTMSGTVADGPFAVGVTKDGAGAWSLTGSNSFTGAVAVNAGTLKINAIDEATGNAQPLGRASSAVTLGTATAQGTLEYTGAVAATLSRPVTVNGVGGGVILNSSGEVLTLAGTLTKNGRPLTLAGGAFDITGVVAGANPGSDLIVSGATVQLSNAANTYNGPTFVHHGGTLKLGVETGIPAGSTVTLGEAAGNTAGTLDLNGFGQTLIGLNSAGTGASVVTNQTGSGPGTLTITGAGVFGGVIQNEVALTKSGSGVFELTGANTYTGATQANGGTLLVSGSLSGTSAVSVSSGGVLAGSGTITPDSVGGVSIDFGGSLAPGKGVGTLNVVLGSGQFDLSSAAGGTGYLQFELGSTNDRVRVVGGALNLGSGLDLDDFAFSDSGGFAAGTYVLFDSSADIVGDLGPNTVGTVLGLEATLSLGGGANGREDVILTVVPEPGAAWLLLLGGTALVRRRRRQRSFAV